MGEMPDIQIPLGFDMEVDEATMLNGLSGSNSTVENGVYTVDETIVSTAANGGPIWTTIKAVSSSVTGEMATGLFCVAQGVYGNGLQGRFRFNGVMKVRVDGTTDVAVGDELVPVTAQNYLVLGSSGASNTGKCIGKALEAMTAAVSAAGYRDIWVAFKGIAGFGHCYA